jgi:heparan-alpha-glucosaminide N-acetyltransferase
MIWTWNARRCPHGKQSTSQLPLGDVPMTVRSAPPSGRLTSLDAYRGFIMLAMVSAGLGTEALKYDPDWNWLAEQLEHTKWVGWTFWDLIQPSFMFMVGVAMPFAFAKRRDNGQSWTFQFLHVVKRCLLLIGIGIVMDSFNANLPVVQFIRVLQQIAIGYFIAFLVMQLSPRWQAVAIVAILAGHTIAYWAHGGSAAWDWGNRDSNFGRELDRRMHQPFVDMGFPNILPLSRGFYVTFNAVSSAATILIGVLVGELLRAPWSSGRKVLILLGAGGAGIGLGMLLGIWVPQVKKLWTASFALFAAGCTCWMMLVFYAIIDIFGWRGWAWPLVVVGVNSIFIYFSSDILKGPIKGVLKPFSFEPLQELGAWGKVVLASLVVFAQWLLCWFLYRHRIFFKV